MKVPEVPAEPNTGCLAILYNECPSSNLSLNVVKGKQASTFHAAPDRKTGLIETYVVGVLVGNAKKKKSGEGELIWVCFSVESSLKEKTEEKEREKKDDPQRFGDPDFEKYWSVKQSIVYVEESNLLEKIDGSLPGLRSSYRLLLSKKRKSHQPSEERQSANGGKHQAKKQGEKKNAVDLRALLRQYTQAATTCNSRSFQEPAQFSRLKSCRNSPNKKLIDYQQVRHNLITSSPDYDCCLKDNVNVNSEKERGVKYGCVVSVENSRREKFKSNNWGHQYKKDAEVLGNGSSPILMVFEDFEGNVKRVIVDEYAIFRIHGDRYGMGNSMEVKLKILHEKSLAREMEIGKNVILRNRTDKKSFVHGVESGSVKEIYGFSLPLGLFPKFPMISSTVLLESVVLRAMKKLLTFGVEEVHHVKAEKEVMGRKIKSREKYFGKGRRDLFQLHLEAFQGPTPGQNLRHSFGDLKFDIMITMGLRRDFHSFDAAGFTEGNGALGDLFVLLKCDGVQGNNYEQVFVHWKPHPILIVFPKEMGPSVRRLNGQEEMNGVRINSNFAAHQEVDDKVTDVALAGSIALGFAITLEQERGRDSCGRRGTLLGVVQEIVEALFKRYNESEMGEDRPYKSTVECLTGKLSKMTPTQRELSSENQNKLDYILALTVEKFPERHRQTLIFKKRGTTSIYHAQVLIKQRHSGVGRQGVNIPSLRVRSDPRKHTKFTLASSISDGRPRRVKRKMQEAVSMEATKGDDRDLWYRSLNCSFFMQLPGRPVRILAGAKQGFIMRQVPTVNLGRRSSFVTVEEQRHLRRYMTKGAMFRKDGTKESDVNTVHNGGGNAVGISETREGKAATNVGAEGMKGILEKGYVKFGERRVSDENIRACDEYHKIKLVHSIMCNVAETRGSNSEDLYIQEGCSLFWKVIEFDLDSVLYFGKAKKVDPDGQKVTEGASDSLALYCSTTLRARLFMRGKYCYVQSVMCQKESFWVTNSLPAVGFAVRGVT